MSSEEIIIAAAKRSPITSFCGALMPLEAHQIGARVIKATLAQAGISGDEVNETIIGQVLSAGVGMNPARQAARGAGICDAAPAMTINQVCGSGLRAVALGAQQIMTGAAAVVIAGGQESMSNAPHVAPLRGGKKLGDLTLVDTVLRDGLSDAFYGYPMGNTAEKVAELYKISRAEQDAFALASQIKASTAARSGRFEDEIAPISITGRKGEIVVQEDEYIRHDADLAGLEKLRPAFIKQGTVTAGNSSGINDGAAAVLLMSALEAKRRDIVPLASIVAFAHTGLDPEIMGLGPISASLEALEKAGWQKSDVDLWEINEAFAAQSLTVVSELGIKSEKVNVNGGAIALGHPIGASGARVLTTLIYEMTRRDARRGLATLCIGGGMGIAMCVARD